MFAQKLLFPLLYIPFRMRGSLEWLLASAAARLMFKARHVISAKKASSISLQGILMAANLAIATQQVQ